MGDYDRDEADNPVSGAEEPPSTAEVHRSNGADSISSDYRAGENQVKVVGSQGQEEEAMSIGEYYQKKCRERTKNLEKKWREVKLAHKNFKVIAVGRRRLLKRKVIRLLRSNCRGKSKKVSFIAIEIWQDEKGRDGESRYEGGDQKGDEDGADRKGDEDGATPLDDEDDDDA